MLPEHIVSGDRPIFLLSDVHLGDGGWGDLFGKKDEALLNFLEQVRNRAGALLLVGDILDFQQAWTFKRILRAHRAVLKELGRIGDTLPVIYVAGNHDPDIELFEDLLRWNVVEHVVIDDQILVQHGDEYDSYIGGNQSSDMATRVHNLLERLLHTWIRAPLVDHYTPANRLTHYLFYYYAQIQRLRARRLLRRGKRDKANEILQYLDVWTRTEFGDPMSLTRPILDRLRQDHYHTVICGHSHMPGLLKIGNGRRYANLGSWSFGNAQYGVLHRGELLIRDWISQRVYGDENYRSIIDDDLPQTYEDWFRNQYMGWFRFRAGEEQRKRGLRRPLRPLLGPLALSRPGNNPNTTGPLLITTIEEPASPEEPHDR